MSKEDFIKTKGSILDHKGGITFTVKLDNGRTVSGYLSGKMQINSIKLIPGDKVTVEISPYDLTKCRIISRDKA